MGKIRSLTEKPVYVGERGSKTNTKDRLYCQKCDRLATHRALRFDLDGLHAVPYDVHFCESHLKEQIKVCDIRRCKELPEFKRHLKKLNAWTAAQQNTDEQQVLELDCE